jgi:hypothetical protein
MSRWGSRTSVHLTVVVRLRIVEWGVGGLERDVIKLIDIRDCSGVLALIMHGQNGGVLFAVMNHFSFRMLSLFSSIGFGSFGNASSSGGISGVLLVLVENFRWFWILVLVLATSGTRTSSSKGVPGSELFLP